MIFQFLYQQALLNCLIREQDGKYIPIGMSVIFFYQILFCECVRINSKFFPLDISTMFTSVKHVHTLKFSTTFVADSCRLDLCVLLERIDQVLDNVIQRIWKLYSCQWYDLFNPLSLFLWLRHPWLSVAMDSPSNRYDLFKEGSKRGN